MEFQPYLNGPDDEWVTMVGRYMLNMGAIEFATRSLVLEITGTDDVQIYRDELARRLAFLRSRFPRNNQVRHEWAMNVFAVAKKHVTFRNIVAHSSIVLAEQSGMPIKVVGLVNVTPADKQQLLEIISLAEMKGRVDESARIGQEIMTMKLDYKNGVTN